MQIKTYTAASMKEVLSQIKSEMGPEAVIVSTRQIKDGTPGRKGSTAVEVTAAIDYDELRREEPPSSEAIATPLFDQGLDVKQIGAELSALKGMVKALLDHNGLESRAGGALRELLVEKGIRASLVDLVLSKLGDRANAASIKDLFSKVVRTTQDDNARTQIFVGATGVGKTTTIAKLAARAVLSQGLKTAMITLDTYRIGAVEQGRTYAKILGVPFVSVTSSLELKRAVEEFSNMDRIFVDTVGRSPASRENIQQLCAYTEALPMSVSLLMPVATRDAEMERAMRSFMPLKINHMIFTKADEALTAGTILTHNLVFRTPISYITNGQRVPEDIERAETGRIIDLCLGDMA